MGREGRAGGPGGLGRGGGSPQAGYLRLFVAWELPEALLAALERLQGELRAQAPALRWVRLQGIHLTLKFLGEVGESRVPAIIEALRRAAEPTAPLAIALGRPGSFGGRQGPTVIWVRLEGDLEALAHLQRQVEGALAPLGFPPEERPFHPHLTLARVPPESAADGRRLEALLPTAHLPSPEPFTIEEISLMRSILGPGGAAYQRLATLPLAGRE